MTESFTFTGRDYTAELERLVTLLQTELPTYTDFNHSSVGMALLRLLARETDQLNYYIDRVAQEGFINTCLFRQSLIELGSLVGYAPTLASPASTRLLLTRIVGVTGNISIPAYSEFTNSDGIPYITVSAAMIADGEETVEVNAIQGTFTTSVFTSLNYEAAAWTGRTQILLGTNVCRSQMLVWEEGEEEPIYWTYEESFWRSSADDKHYTLELNGDDDSVYLVFGDGVQGATPPVAGISCQFVATLCASGNMGIGTITTVSDDLIEYITATNTEIATGGAVSETTESMRRMIPAVTRTQRRGVIADDYESLLEHEPGILHVQVLDRNTSEEWPHLYVVIYIVPEGGGPITSYLQDQVHTLLTACGHLGNWPGRYILRDVTEVPVDITCQVGIITGYSAATVTQAVIAAINNLFLPTNRTIAGSISLAELHAAVDIVPGVLWADLDMPSTTFTTSDGEIAVAGAITVTVGT